MNEVMMRSYVKKVMTYGVPKLMAIEIAENAISASKGKDVEKYIEYAIKLVYGFGLEKRHLQKI